MYNAGRKFFILLGTVCGMLGVMIIINPTYYHSELRYFFDFTEVKWPFGILLVCIGALFIWSSFRKKAFESEAKYKEMEKVFMCSQCVKPYQKTDVPDLKCPVCDESLEELTGFYERHPDIK